MTSTAANTAQTDTSVYVPETDSNIPLVTDLDRTLCRSDTMHDALVMLLFSKPALALHLPRWLGSGKAAFKAQLADHLVPDPARLPYDEKVIELLRQARAEGRRTALVSASDHRVVEAVAAHLNLFDDVIGTGSDGNGQNLSRQAKADMLVSRYGVRGYDYIGDSAADVPVWAQARTALAVRPDGKLHADAARAGVTLEDVTQTPTGFLAAMRPRLRALRPHQWVKNLLVFLPVLAAHDASSLPVVLIAFIAFCLTASAVYIVNDLADLAADRAHKRKRYRPLASGALPVGEALVMAAALFLSAIALSVLLTPPAFVAVLLVYVVATFAYSLWIKRKLLIDVVALSGLYTLRIVAGAVAAGIVLSTWLLGFSMFLFFSLAAVKRQAELTDIGPEQVEAAPGRAYAGSDLPVIRSMAITSGQAAVLVLALYISSDDVIKLYAAPNLLWLVCPILFYWISRMVLITHRGHMTDDPIVYAARDWRSLLAIALVAIVVVAAVFWGKA
ncbi:MAG: UbiA family prenyltransferase [Roseinatronobacter sp.]